MLASDWPLAVLFFKYQDKDFCSIDAPAYSRVTLK